jgi:peptide/nickel transport system substrate-binding protein
VIQRTTAARSLIAGVAVTSLAVLAACGSSGGSGASGTSSTGASAGTPVHGGDLTIARVSDSQSMNLTTVFDNESIWIGEQIMQPLYTVTNDGKNVKPWLATGYKVSADKKTYTFTLRPGVKFSTGQLMTSKDVVFSLEQTMKAAQGWGFIDTAIKSVTAPTSETVAVHLKFAWAPILADLSLFANGIVPANYGGQTETQFYTHPVGTGPFKWDFWHKGASLKLVKNTHYWQPGKPYLNSITWTDTSNDNTREQQLEGATATQPLIDEFPAWSTVASLKARSGVNMDLFNSTQTNYLAFNEQRKPFQDVHVRRAISLALNRAALVKAVLFGNGKPANSLFPPQVPFYQASTPGLQYNLAQAKQEMAKSTVPHGFTTTLLVAAGNSDNLTIATIAQAELKPLGITVKIQQLDANTTNTDFQTRKYDMTESLWTMDIADPDELATFALNPKSGAKSFYTSYDNPTVVKDVSAAERTLSASTRQTLYNTIQTDAANDAFMSFLYYSPYPYATTGNVRGFFVTPLGNYHAEDIWISK